MQNETNRRTWSRQRTNDPAELQRRFWCRVQIGGIDECWPWIGAKWSKTGYGKVDVLGGVKPAHRLAFKYSRGYLDELLDVCHRCDNTICSNPFHLFQGTAKENVQDCIQKGRFITGNRRGDGHFRANLTEEKVRRILADPEWSWAHRPQLAKEFGVTYGCIDSVLHRRVWKWVQMG